MFRLGRPGIGILLATLTLCLVSESYALTIGSISRDIRDEIDDFKEIIAYLNDHAAEIGVDSVDIHVTSTQQDMIESLRSGKVDVYVDSPLIGALIGRSTGAKPFLRRWKKGDAQYHTLIVTRADSDIETLDDLRGQIVAFDEPFSSSGHLIPKSMLREHGLDTIELVSSDQTVPADKVGYIYTQDDNNTIYWIFRGRVAAGATSPNDLAKFEEKAPGTFKVIAKSIDVPRHVLMRGAHLDEDIVNSLERVLTNMENTEQGKWTLRKFQKTTRFDRFPKGAEKTFEPIERMLDLLSDEFGD